MKNKQTLEQDLSLKFVHLIYGLINKHTVKRFTYYHDTYIDKGCVVHMHKFKRKGIISYKKLKELCNYLEQEGINGFQPTSAKTERYSGIVLYHKVKIEQY